MMQDLDFVRKDIDLDLCNYRVDQKELVDKAILLGELSDTPEVISLTYISLSLSHENINCEFELVFTIPKNQTITITIPIIEQEPKDPLGYYVLWGDKTIPTHNTQTHTYFSNKEEKKYIVKFFGLGISSFGFRNGDPESPNSNYSKYLTSVSSFGKLGHVFTSLSFAFRRCVHNITLPDYLPSNITDLSGMFAACLRFNQPLNNWNVSRVNNMSKMFNACFKFNQCLNDWNVSNVIDMSFMFSICQSFDQPLNNWNVSNVINIKKMFSGCIYNLRLDNWNVSNVVNMKEMFNGPMFNQSISNWNVSNVLNSTDMFVISPIVDANKPIFNI